MSIIDRKKDNNSASRESQISDGIFYPFLTAYYLTLAGMLISSFFPESRLWGINWLLYFPSQITYMLIGLAVLLPLLFLRFERGHQAELPSSERQWLLLSLFMIVGFLVLFYLFRCRTHFLGDGYQLLARLASDGSPKPWNASVFYSVKSIYNILGLEGAAGARFAYQLVSYLSGFAFLVVASYAAWVLFKRNRDRALFVIGIGTGGYSLLFFGYVENYPLLAVVTATFTLAGMVVLAGGLPRWVLLPMVITGLLIHPYAVSLIPAAGYIIFKETKLAYWFSKLRSSYQLVLALICMLIILLTFIYLYSSSYFLRFAIVPLIEDRFTVEGYTFSSWKHLQDIGNLLFQLLPALPMMVIMFFVLPVRKLLQLPNYSFLVLLILPSLLLLIIFDPKLGMPRDWDLFSFAGIPIAILFYFALLDEKNMINKRHSLAVMALTLGVLMLAGRVYTQVLPEKSITFFDYAANLDIRKNRAGQQIVYDYLNNIGEIERANERNIQALQKYPHQLLLARGKQLSLQGDQEGAIAQFQALAGFDPSFYAVWANLGKEYAPLGKLDSALTFLKISDGLNPYNSNIYSALGRVYVEMNDFKQAEDYWNRALRISPDDYQSRGYLLHLYSLQNRWSAYDKLLAESAARKKAPVELLKQYGEYLLTIRDFKRGNEFYKIALMRGLDSSYIRELQIKHPALRIIR